MKSHLFMTPSNLVQLREAIPNIEPDPKLQYIDGKVYLLESEPQAGEQMRVELLSYLKYVKKNSEMLQIADGRTYTMHGFGAKVGQCEIDSDELKSIKGDIYVLNSGMHILQILSALAIKAPVLQMSSGSGYGSLPPAFTEVDYQMNGRVAHLAADYCPIIGTCSSKTNFLVNFGMTDQIFSEMPHDDIIKSRMALSCLNAKYVAALAVEQIGPSKDRKD